MKIPIITILITTVGLFSCDTKSHESKAQAVQTTKEPEPQPNIDLVIDVKAIAGKKPEEVADILGPPSETSQTKHGPKQLFDAGNIEIIYIKGIADWITINNMKDVSYSDQAIQYLGFSDSRPTFSNQYVKKWESIPGFLEVTLNPGESGKISYVHIKTKTK